MLQDMLQQLLIDKEEIDSFSENVPRNIEIFTFLLSLNWKINKCCVLFQHPL